MSQWLRIYENHIGELWFSRAGLNVSGLISTTALVACITAKIAFIFIFEAAIHMYDFHIFKVINFAVFPLLNEIFLV